ncbi:MAG TPA: RNA polymerase sigma factor [Terriglobales bacterium]
MDFFQQLYDSHAADVYRFALYLCRDRAQAEDITAETFLRALAAPGPIRAASAKAYLLAIARNLYLHHLRKARRQTELDPEWAEAIPDSGATPDHQAQQGQAASMVLAAMDHLPDAERAALLLRAVEGLGYAEIATILRCSLAAVKVNIHRARLALAGVRSLI